MIYTAEKTTEDLKDKISDDEKSKIDGLVSELRELITGDDISAIKEKTDELTKEVQEIGAKIYQEAAAQEAAQQQANGANAGANAGSSQSNNDNDDDNTVDADYTVKDD